MEEVDTIHVDSRGRLQPAPTAGQDGPVVLFGENLLPRQALPQWVQQVARGVRPVYIATNLLTGTGVDVARAAADAGLVAIEFPLPTADPDTYDQLARLQGGLQRTLQAALEWHRAGVDLWVRVPLGHFNRDGLPELSRLLTNDLLGVKRLLFHCSASLGRPPRQTASEDGFLADFLAGFTARLYGVLVELESARLWTGVEHRDGFPLCLFHDEPEPLRYFRFIRAAGQETPHGRGWVHSIEADPDLLVRQPVCQGCRLSEECRGIRTNLIRVPGIGELMPFPASTPDRTVTGPPAAIFQGAPRRLRQHVNFRHFWHPESGIRPVPVQNPVQISPQDWEAVGLHRFRLDGFHLLLARVPWAGSPEEPVVASLALTTLTPFLRAAGARVDPVDCRLLVKSPRDLPTVGGRPLPPENGNAIQRPADSPVARERRQAVLASALIDHLDPQADLLGLSVEVADCRPLAQAMVREWKRRGGGPVAVGGRGMNDHRQLLQQTPELDFCVHGEGEVPLLLLCDTLHRGGDFRNVPGLLYRDPAGHIVDTHAVVHSFDLHPVPDISGIPLDRYDSVDKLDPREPMFLYQFIVGCPHDCAFCGEFNRWRYKVRSPRRVVRDLRYIATRFGCHQFFFVNNLINVSHAYLDQWLDAMEQARLGVQWCDCCRPAGLNAERLARMRRAGCASLTWGIDIMSQALNRRLWKRINLERAADILRLAHREGIRNFVNLIVGMPTETEDDIRETIEYLKRHAAYFHEVSIMHYGFREKSPLGLWPARFGLRRTPEGLDEVDGRTWSQITSAGEEHGRQVYEAVRDHAPVVLL